MLTELANVAHFGRTEVIRHADASVVDPLRHEHGAHAALLLAVFGLSSRFGIAAIVGDRDLAAVSHCERLLRFRMAYRRSSGVDPRDFVLSSRTLSMMDNPTTPRVELTRVRSDLVVPSDVSCQQFDLVAIVSPRVQICLALTAIGACFAVILPRGRVSVAPSG